MKRLEKLFEQVKEKDKDKNDNRLYVSYKFMGEEEKIVCFGDVSEELQAEVVTAIPSMVMKRCKVGEEGS